MASMLQDYSNDNDGNNGNDENVDIISVHNRSQIYYHRCGRMLPTNTLKDLQDLQVLCHTICSNIISNPNEIKYQQLKISNKLLQTRLMPRKGGIEFLLAIGFETRTIDFQKVLVLRSDESDCIVNIKDGLAWLDETINTCITMSQSHQNHQSDRPCAGCVIQIRLSTGVSVTGGFAPNDTLHSVLEFVRCFYMMDKVDNICLRLPHVTKAFDTNNISKTLQDLDLCPRSILIASTLTDSQLVEQMKEIKQKTNDQVQKNVVNADILKREKLKKVENDKNHKQQLLQLFNDDRNDFKERSGSGSITHNL